MGAPSRETLDYFDDLRGGALPGWATSNIRKSKYSYEKTPSQFKSELGRLSEMEILRSQNALGIKEVNSLNDIKEMRDWLIEEAGGGGGGSANEEEGEKEASPRDTGEYDDIIGALQDDIKAANDRADEFANKEAEGITANRDQLGILNQNFQDQILALNEGVELRYAALEDMLGRQSAAMQQNQQMMQQQMMAAQNSYNEQMRMMQNMQRASVPVAEQNAYTAQMGDQREDNSRRKEDNRLSDLSILSGLGTQGSPTAGLSLA